MSFDHHTDFETAVYLAVAITNGVRIAAVDESVSRAAASIRATGFDLSVLDPSQ